MFKFPALRLKQLSAAMLVVGVLSGCTLAPTYERPQAPVEGSYPADAKGQAALLSPAQNLQRQRTPAQAGRRPSQNRCGGPQC